MILKIRNSRSFKGTSMLLALSIIFEIVYPNQSWALTGGPSQPEFGSFTPIGTSDMVDLASGDMSYNIPLMDVGGYPINLAYSSGVGMDDEASWVGLGWNLSVGQIGHNVRGISDDFNGDEIQYENYMRPNFTIGADIKVQSAILGAPINLGENVSTIFNPTTGLNESTDDDDISFGLAMSYNNYNGFTVKQSVGINVDLKQNVSVGFNAESGPDGLTLSPTVSLHSRNKETKDRNNKLSSTIGASMNSRQGLVSATMSASRKQSRGEQMRKSKEKTKTTSTASLGSSIGFTDQLYTPANRVGMRTYTLTFNGAFGGGEFFGLEGQPQIGAYATVMSVAKKNQNKKSPSYGYCNTESAGINGILDFNREKDGAVSQNTTNLPITNYTYDIHSVQGQGVSGMYRAFRSQVGYVYDARVVDVSATGALGLEVGVGNLAHTGVDFEGTGVVSYSGKWEKRNDILPWMEASSVNPRPDYETVSYKNVGDLSSDRDFNNMFADQGNYQATRVGFWSSKPINFNRRANSGFKKKINGEGNEIYDQLDNAIHRDKRQLRNQTIVNVSVGELKKGIGYGPAVVRGASSEYTLPSQAKSHHVGEVQIIRNDGARYIYGIPAYNTTKREATFAVAADGNCTTGIVDFSDANLADLSTPESLPNDQFLERITTPGYAHAHLLTSILSTDYVDRTNNGPTADDYGSYTKFSYKTYSEINPGQTLYRWRVPYEGASYNEGLKSDDQDDRGNYVYGEKEILLVDMISTKTHVAKFIYSARKDAHGVAGEQGGFDANMKSYKLDAVKLYSIEEYYDVDGNGNQVLATNPTPIKTAHFVYDYSLCKNVPNNPTTGTLSSNELSNDLGKLTLKQVYFTYRNSKMGEYTKYKFSYNTLNPDYNIKGYDYWGNYKPNPNGCDNTDAINASEYPYTEQDRAVQDPQASAWSLTDIELPSGGKITVTYESDDYGFVQDKKTMRMFKVIGAGNDSDPLGNINLNESEELFGNQLLNKAKRYLYVQVDDDPSFTADDYIDRLKEEKIQFRFFMNMTPMGNNPNKLDEAKYDYVSGYFEYEDDNSSTSTTTSGYDGPEVLTGSIDHDADISTPNIRVLSIPVRVVDKEGGLTGSAGLANKVHPISKASWHFGRKYLNKHVYSPLPNGDISTPQNPVVGQVGQLVVDLLSPQTINNLIEIFTGPNATLENKNIGRRFIKEKSWIRLDNPRSYKLGGGCRVSKIQMSDVWAQMTNAQGSYQTMNYGQQYSYALKNGQTSGVATYEPVGNKENPFVQPVFTDEKKLLAPDEQNFVEMPFGESFFPSPQVTYSRVSVSNLTAGTAPPSGFANAELKKLHRTGKVVTEFYTSKDYPTIVDQTILMAREDKLDALGNILKINVKRHFTGTQGYVIHLNDMNGKQKAQWVYAEGQDAPISGVEYKYDGYTTPNQFSAANDPERNKGRLNNEVVVISPDGTVGKGTIGVEVDMVNDFRENKTITATAGVNMNLATFFVGVGILATPLPLPDFSNSEDQFRSASTTKVINTFGILRETIAHDAGATVSTRNLAWDEFTGEVLLTETVDEFSDRYYTFNYPAHWHYDGMGQAAQNIAYATSVVGNGSGDYTVLNVGSFTAEEFLIEGDEVYFIPNDASAATTYQMGWITNVTGNTISIIDENGTPIGTPSYASTRLKVIRSGRRNLQSAGIMNVTLMKNPLLNQSGTLISSLGANFLVAAQGNWEDWRIINAGAVDYSEEWFVGCECGTPSSGIGNPYRINEKGVWRTRSSRTYLTGRNNAPITTGRQEGFFTSFTPMYRNISGGWTKNFTGWTYVAEVTQYSPYGFELENVDALNRYSAAQYGYNNTFPMAVGANTRYQEIGYDGFEDYNFKGCEYSEHFKFPYETGQDGQTTNPSTGKAHTGKYSLRVGPNSRKTMDKKLDCDPLPKGEQDDEPSGGGSNE